MSKPVTNAQIEDVLSSIRRLVSEEIRTDPRVLPQGGAGEAAPKALAETAGRLVLTPSLRVDEEVEAPAEAAAVPAAADWAGADWSDDDAWAAPEGPQGDIVEAFVAEEQTAELALAGSDEELLAEGGFDDYDTALDEGAVQGDYDGEDDTGAQADDRAEEGDLAAALRRVAALSAVAPAAEPEPELEIEPESAVAEAVAEEDEPPYFERPFQSSRSESLSAKIEALEAAIGRTRDQWEPDGDSDDAYAGTRIETIAWRDHDGAAKRPAAEVEAAAEATAETAADSPLMVEEDAVMDEDSLRELVAEIVRQELQGALGERITRNVRKLVRREIHRALAAQDLE
ncbi:MAG: hypothetical protein AB7S99_01020 [Pseudodonghicola sp.]